MTDQEAQDQPRKHTKPTRRAWIMRGVVTPIFGLLAVACIVLGALNSTIWKPSRDITATAQAQDTQYIVVDPGVLDLVDKAVTVTVDADASAAPSASPSASTDTATTQDQQNDQQPQTCMAIGSAKDVAGWLAGESYTRVTGMDSWTALATSTEQPQGTASTSESQVAFADSDMWTSVECGQGTATMQLNDAQPSQVMLVDLGAKETDADISMHWVRQSVPDFALPWYFAGGLCAVLAVLSASVFAMEPHNRRKKPAETEPKKKTQDEKPGEETTIGAALAGTFAALKPSRPKKGAGGRRHARHAGAAEDESAQMSSPTVVDPAARNLVAEHARHTAEGEAESAQEHAEETTSVISADELQAYFARLAQEVGAKPVQAAEPTETTTPDAEKTPDTDDERPDGDAQAEGKENE